MSLSVALNNAVTGLQVNQRSLDIVSRNITNVNTPGYSRKIVQTQAIVLGGQGSGVEIASITRRVSDNLLKDLRTQMANLGSARVEDEYLSRTQEMFGSLDSNSSIGAQLATLGDSFQALAAFPEDVSARISLLNRASFLANDFNTTASNIQDLRVEADRAIEAAIDTVNSQLALIQELNIKISESKALGNDIGDMEDQRDTALALIAEQMEVTSFTRDAGDMVIMTGTGRMLLDRTAATLVHDAAAGLSPSISWAAGSIAGITLGASDITTEIASGRINALIEMRDTTLPNLYSQLDELAGTVHDEINALHNKGTPPPGLPSMTGTRTVAAGDTPVWSGNLRIAVNSSAGVLVEYQDFNLAGYATVGALVTAIDGMANLSASIGAGGKLVLTPTGSNAVALNEMNSAATLGSRTVGAGTFLGLNDFFTSTANYDTYTSAQTINPATALNLAGTLTFAGSFGTANIGYAVGNSLNAVAASINASAGLAAANITASVVTDGSGYRLRINDSDGNNFFITDSGSLVGNLAVKPRDNDLISEIALRSDLAADSSRISRATLSGASPLVVGSSYVGAGDNSMVQALANRFNAAIHFDATGQLAAGDQTLSDYGASILSRNATQAKQAADQLSYRSQLFDNLSTKAQAVSGVNLDEEMSNMILLENAYAAAARVISTTRELFDILSNLGR